MQNGRSQAEPGERVPAPTTHRRWAPLIPLLILGLTALLYLPGLWIGFLTDDYFWLPALHPPVELTGRVAPYFIRFAEPDVAAYWQARGVSVWWAGADFQWTLMRPLANRLMGVLWDTFGANPLPFHLISWLAYLGLVWTVGELYRRYLPGAAGLLAMALFALHFSHLQTVWLMCNQHSIFSALGGLLGLRTYLRWQEDAWKPGLPLSLLAFAGGLLFSETAVAMVGYLLAYTLLGTSRPWRERLLAPLPVLGLLVVYLGLHHGLGYTTRGSLLYLDPSAGLLPFLASSAGRLVALWDGLLGAGLADFWTNQPQLRPILTGLAGLSLALMAWMLPQVWRGLEPDERRTLAWLGGGSLLALGPGLASPPGGRLLLCATMGGSAVLALLFRHAWRQGREAGNVQRLRWGLAVGPLVGLHLGLYPLAIVPTLTYVRGLSEAQAQVFDQPVLDATRLPSQDLIVLNMPGAMASLTFLSGREVMLGAPLPRTWTVLSCEPVPMRVTRTDAHTLTLEVLSGSLLGEGHHRLFRPAHWPVRVGDRFEQGHVTATVEAINQAGPTRVAFRFERSLDDPGFLLLMWGEGGLPRPGEEHSPPQGPELRGVPMPLVGAQVTVPVVPSPLGPGM